MKLAKLLERIVYQKLQGDEEMEVAALSYDSRTALPDCAFVCIRGMKSDGHDYIPEVITKGAAVLVVEQEIVVPEQITVILVPDTRLALAQMSAAYFGYPAEHLTTIGITGTKGKTTTAYMIHTILNQAGIRAGLIGTVEVRIGDKSIEADRTTPESYQLQEYLHQMVEASLTCVVMEVSSQGLKLNRVGGIEFDYGVFMNLEPDHIGPGEHPDFEDYLRCKALLFSHCKTGIFNADDSHLKQILEGHTCTVETFGLNSEADYCATKADLHQEAGNFGVSYQVQGKIQVDVKVNIPGKFTIYNSLAAIAVCSHFQIAPEIIQNALQLVSVRGRVEMIPVSNRFLLLIDYAHNAMSLQSLLSTLKEYQPKRLVCLFGCGGNRSKDRRYEMGEISSRMADLTVVTSDNPRYEEPESIIEDILTGVKRGTGAYVSIPDRKEAIRYCICTAQEGDVIILAGKGQETYQEIKGVKYPMDERVLIREILEEMTQQERKEKQLRLF